MSYIAGCIKVDNGEFCVRRSAALLHAMRKEIEWFVCQDGDNNGVIGSTGRGINLASNENWILALQGWPLWRDDNNPVDLGEMAYSFNEKSIPEVLKSLAGQYSCAIYSKQNGRLWLYSDKSGAYPLYWVGDEESIIFASQPLCLADITLQKISTSLEAAYGFLWGLTEAVSGCLIDGLSLVAPSEIVSWKRNEGINCFLLDDANNIFDIGELHEMLSKVRSAGIFVPEGDDIEGGHLGMSKVNAWLQEIEGTVKCIPVSGRSAISLSMFLDESLVACQIPCGSSLGFRYRSALIEAKKQGVNVIINFGSWPGKLIVPEDCIQAFKHNSIVDKLNATIEHGGYTNGVLALFQQANTYGINVIRPNASLGENGKFDFSKLSRYSLIYAWYSNVLYELLESVNQMKAANYIINNLIDIDVFLSISNRLKDFSGDCFIDRFEFVWRCVCLKRWFDMLGEMNN